MPVELVVAPEAELDIAEAFVWYEDRRADWVRRSACLKKIRCSRGLPALPYDVEKKNRPRGLFYVAARTNGGGSHDPQR